MSSSANRQKATVIVIDDDVSICRALKRQLEIFDFNVLVFYSAEGLLATEIPTRKACLLSDVYLPAMSGIELCQNLAAAGLHLPAVLMSGRDDEQTRKLMTEANPVASLFKPFDQEELIRALRKALRPRLNSRH